MQRRLVKSLEDLSVQYDRSVRNSTGEMIQLLYGGDALDPTYMEGKDRPVDFQRALDHIKAVNPHKDEDPLDEEQLIEAFGLIAATDAFLNCGEEFREEFKYYIVLDDKYCTRLTLFIYLGNFSSNSRRRFTRFAFVTT